MNNQEVLSRFVRLYEELFSHDGFGEIRVEIRLLKRGQKEVILHCGKQYRYVVDCVEHPMPRAGAWRVVKAHGGETQHGDERRRHQQDIDFPDRRRRSGSAH